MSTDTDQKGETTFLKGPTLGYTDNFPKRQMWKEIAGELNGEFKIKHNSGRQLEIHTISIPYKKWKLEISVSDNRPLKFQSSFSAGQKFDMIISGEDFFEKILKKFRKPEIRLGWKEFDKRYLVKSNRSDLAKETVSKGIMKAMLKYNVYSVAYQSHGRAGTSELIAVIQRHAGNKEMIFELIDMYKQLIDNLDRLRIIKSVVSL